MTEASLVPPVADLPAGLSARLPALQDVDCVAELVRSHQEAVRGSSAVDPASIASAVAGTASWTRRQLLVEDAGGRLVAWASVHDRAAGRTVVDVTVAPDTPDTPDAPTPLEASDASVADSLAAALFAWVEATALDVARQRGGGRDPARRERLLR